MNAPFPQHISASHHVLYLIVLAIESTAARIFRDTLVPRLNKARITHAAFWTTASAGWRFFKTSLWTGVCTGLVVAVRIARNSCGLTRELTYNNSDKQKAKNKTNTVLPYIVKNVKTSVGSLFHLKPNRMLVFKKTRTAEGLAALKSPDSHIP